MMPTLLPSDMLAKRPVETNTLVKGFSRTLVILLSPLMINDNGATYPYMTNNVAVQNNASIGLAMLAQAILIRATDGLSIDR